MQIGEFARRVGRSVDTIKRWEDEGLLRPDRDGRGHRVYRDEHVAFCLQLTQLSLLAQRRSQKLRELTDGAPAQLSLPLAEPAPPVAEPERLAV